MGFLTFGSSHVFNSPDPRRAGGLPHVLQGKGKNETKAATKTLRTTWQSSRWAKAPHPLAFSSLPGEVVPKYGCYALA